MKWYRVWKLKRQLAAYKKTLRPSQAAWANELEARLKDKTPNQSAAILRSEINRVTLLQFRLVEKLETVTSKNS